MHRIRPLVLMALCLLWASCERPPKEVPVSSVSLSASSMKMFTGETCQLTATVHPADATDKTVMWEASNPSVATVNASGLVTAVSAGETVITASAGGQSATCRVEVGVAVASVTLDKTRLNLTVGATVILTATVNPEDATDRTVVWSSTDDSVASVDQDGKVTAHKGGTASVLATAGGQSATAFVDVCEVSPASVEVEGAGGVFDVTVVCAPKWSNLNPIRSLNLTVSNLTLT